MAKYRTTEKSKQIETLDYAYLPARIARKCGIRTLLGYTYPTATFLEDLLNRTIPLRDSFRSVKSPEERKINRIYQICNCVNNKQENLLLKALDKDELLNIKLYCGHRICPVCNKRAIKTTRRKIHSFIDTYEFPRFAELGTANRPHLTREWLIEVNKQFHELVKFISRPRNREFWEDIIRESDWLEDKKEREIENIRSHMPQKKAKYSFGRYVLSIEIKYHNKGDEIRDTDSQEIIGHYKENCWNVHFHILYDGDYISSAILSYVWRHVSGGRNSYVDVRHKSLLKDRHKSVNYITKYLTKTRFESSDMGLSEEYYNAIRGMRFCRIVGDKIPKREARYIRLSVYLSTLKDKNQRMQYADILLLEFEISRYMNKKGISRLDLEKLSRLDLEELSRLAE